MENKKEKHLYSFEQKDKSGNTRKFAILKPTRRQKEEGELYYSSKLSSFISSGILPKIVWDKVFKDNGGIVSDSDKREYSDSYIKMAELKSSLDSLQKKDESALSKDEKNEIEMLELEILRIRREMQDLEMMQINAFENTAEAKARNKTIIWWAANLGAEEKNGKFENLLIGSDIEDKLDFYENEVENDTFLSKVFSRINYLVTIWYLGSASSSDEFSSFDKEYMERIEIEEGVEEIEEKNNSVASSVEIKEEDSQKELAQNTENANS